MNDRAPAISEAPESSAPAPDPGGAGADQQDPPPASKRRRFLVPEVIQTSAMDCGPAALKCLLAGYGVNASYGRLREACQTSIDGTSIDTLEALAGQLGLEVEQITLPVENLVLPEAAALPALVVVVLPSGLTHFVVVWRRHGPWVQVMDPARGRRWMRSDHLLREVYRHENRIPADAFREWAESDGFRDPLATRLRRLGVGRAARALVGEALAEPGWQRVAALDAATRATEALVDRAAIPRHRAADAVRALYTAAAAEGPGAAPLVGDGFWMAKPAPPSAAASEEGETLMVRGAILIRVVGKRVAPAAGDAPAAVPAEVARVIEAREQGPAEKLVELLRADGLWRWPPLVAGLVLASLGAVFEALLFRGFLDVGRRLQLVEQRLFAVVAMVALLVGLLCIEWPLARGLWGLGRRLEVRLRRAFLEKIPRLEDRYFQSRPVSDMAERAHLVHWLRLLPGQGGQLLRAVAEMTATVAGIVWLHPPSAAIALALAGAMVGTPLLFQPALVERDLRMRSHAGGLARFYLDALLGLTAIRAHSAEAATTRDHSLRLWEWARAAWDSARTTVSAEAVQLLVGFALAGWLLFDYLVSAAGSGWALLLVYWALALPVLGQEIGFLIQQYPRHRNVTLRLVEPLGAPESAPAAPGRAEVVAAAPAGGAEVRIERVAVRLAGHEILAIDDLAIAAGSQVAIVGASGSGKTSLVGLLLGWHEPSEGRVLVDGRPLDAEAVIRLRRETVWVEPGVYLWNRSLLENLRYGAGEDRAGAVGAAIEEAELDELLGRLPVGLQTPLGEGGALLSGGEGQRVRFGRGVVRGPARLVVLDEAFRGLERPRRRAMLERARARWAGATILCVTHDVAHTLGFERVLVVAGGRIAEDGSPTALAAQPGSRYRTLLEAEWRVQARLRGDEWRQLVVDAGGVRAATEVRSGAPDDEESPS